MSVFWTGLVGIAYLTGLVCSELHVQMVFEIVGATCFFLFLSEYTRKEIPRSRIKKEYAVCVNSWRICVFVRICEKKSLNIHECMQSKNAAGGVYLTEFVFFIFPCPWWIYVWERIWEFWEHLAEHFYHIMWVLRSEVQ